MPALSSYTVKKSDETTDILWTGIVPSSGDRTPAIWRSLTVGGTIATKPEFKMSSRDSGDGLTRRVLASIAYPEYVTVDSQQKVVNKSVGDFTWALPKGMLTTNSNEAVLQSINLLYAMRWVIAGGFAPT